MPERAAALAVALGIDCVFGEIGGTWHPVALAGRLLDEAHRPWRGRGPVVELAGGAASVVAVAGLAAFAAGAAERRLPRGVVRALFLGLMLKPTFAIRSLLEAADGVAGALERDQLDVARARLRALVSRPTGSLTEELAASAAIESVAENLADSVAAPLLFYAVFGLPGAAAYRVVNTADAMFGYRGETEWLGKAAARLDDLLNWVPSRLSALALTAAAGLVAGQGAASRAARSWDRDAELTASPNAGRPMAAMAGALGRRLEKRGHYVLGAAYPPPGARDVRDSIRLVAVGASILALAGVAAGWRR
jgi:adenosylcobinamide-phosphate synthase